MIGHKHLWQCTCIALLCLASAEKGIDAADWAHWNGPHRHGTTSETSGWDGKDWLRDKPAWRGTVGDGGTTPLVVGDRLYTMGWENGKDTLYCLHAHTGKRIWKKFYPCPQHGRHARGDQGWYKGVTSTPAYDKDTGLLYTLSCDGDLICWRAANGQRRWHKNLYETYKVGQRPGNRDYGYTSSPLVWGDSVVVEVGAKEGNLITFEKRTGKQQWSSRNADAAGHTTGPVPIRVDGVDCVAVLTNAHLLIVRTDGKRAGETVGEYDWEVHYNNGIPSVCVAGDRVVITSGYNQNRICLLGVSLDGVTLLDEVKRDCSKVCTPVFHEGHLYIAYEDLRCYRLVDDRLQLRWKSSDRDGHFGRDGSCLVTGDNRLVVFGSRGRDFKLALAETANRSPKRCRVLTARHKVFDGRTGSARAWPRVVLAHNRVYCKDVKGNIVCFRLKR
jgi:outer membrane protein assembly factor BamB